MILTYKVKHGRDFSRELFLARKVASYAMASKSMSSKDVKHLGLPSAISNQVLRKYSRNKTIKGVRNVKLSVPSQGIKREGDTIRIPCVKLTLPITFPSTFEKVNQVEIGGEYAYISVTFKDPVVHEPMQVIGVDRNSTRHIVVASNISTGKVLKLGKVCHYVHQKYKHIRRGLQKARKLGLVKKIKHRESNIVRNMNHHISKRLVQEAHSTQSVLVLEDLKEIRQRARCRKKQRYTLHSWSFYQLASMIEYKAKKFGVPLAYVEPQYTSQRCSRCGHIDKNNRKGNLFCCLKCGTVEDAGANAGFNIAYLFQQRIPRFSIDSDMLKGSTDTPREATQ